ncbi:MAG TPA: thiamine phosphate synthase [Candidatus Thioglobus sp.]|jgi:thiamine-phosphate pyrophosphorylase|nr:thiamine phosphate synthase [Candidatus Thioglobus sp.]HIL42525.1 thiamine phosphate synthase [Gammaproteobacteria bacterium]
MKQPSNQRISGIYAITTDDIIDLDLVAKVIVKHNINILQYRRKTSDEIIKYKEAKNLQQLCSTHNTLFIINDDINLAEKIDADGVHLGKNDESIVRARMILGDKAIIGASCYNDLNLAIKAQMDGADYVAFGSIFNSSTKPSAQHCSLAVITKAKRLLDIPIVGIGGINFDNQQLAYNAGCDAVAIITALVQD